MKNKVKYYVQLNNERLPSTKIFYKVNKEISLVHRYIKFTRISPDYKGKKEEYWLRYCDYSDFQYKIKNGSVMEISEEELFLEML